MMPPLPAPPAWTVDWPALRAAHPWVEALHACPQDPTWHGEGDVGVHTRMVLEALVDLEAWRRLPPEERAEVYLACLLHDVAKPRCTRTDAEGRIGSPGHSRAGAVAARAILWRWGVQPEVRERICGLVEHHQLPFFLVEREAPERPALTASLRCRTDHLALVALADALGRVAADRARLVDNIGLFELACQELSCWGRPYPFADDNARVAWARDPRRCRHDVAPTPRRLTAYLLSGLPAAGKDHWAAAQGLPVLSLDAIRQELGVDWRADQGLVRQVAKDRARALLRAGHDFVLNATHLTRERRRPWLSLLWAYDARIELVCVEASEGTLRARNAARERPVAEGVLDRMIARWEAPDRTEAHGLRFAPGE